MAAMTVLKAVEVGVDVVDTALSPFACGTSLSSTESVVSAFLNTPYVPEVDTHALAQATEYFTELRNRYMENGTIHRDFLRVDTSALKHQIPGGMYSRLLAQICDYQDPTLLSKVLSEIPRVRADAGYPPLVTPLSQVIGTQALRNVMDGERYKTVTDEFKALIGGRYGRTPAPIDPDFRHMILGDIIPITYRPADALEPEVEHFRSIVAPYAEQEEDLLTLALFDKVAVSFFEWRKNLRYKIDKRASRSNITHPVR
jgi:oxaloacetate decarboxylase alpha subunit